MGFLHSKERTKAGGRALIIGADALRMKSGPGYTPGIGTTVHSNLRVRVTPDDGGPEFESHLGAWGGDEEHLVRGHWTYVVYDPEQPDGCDMDSARLLKEFGKVNGKKRRTSVPQWVSDEWSKQTLNTVDAQPTQPAPIADAGQSALPASGSDRIVADLKDLAQLHAGGALSDAEYAQAKSRLLAHD